MRASEFQTAIKNANTIEELQQLRFHTASTQTAAVKAKIYELGGWKQYQISTSTLKAIVGETKSDCNHLENTTIKNSRVLSEFNGKKVSIYVQEKLNCGGTSIILVREL